MRRPLLSTLALLALAGCVTTPPTPPTPPVPFSVQVFTTAATTGAYQPATAYTDATVEQNKWSIFVGENGALKSDFIIGAFNVCAAAPGFLTECRPIPAAEDQVFRFALVANPVPPIRPPTRAETRRYRGFLGSLRDTAGRIIWTPALPGATPDVRKEWLETLVRAGATHVPIGWFDPGLVYPRGVEWPNPDWRNNPQAIRALIDEIQATRASDGAGLRPVIFTAGWSAEEIGRARATLREHMAVLAQAVEGLDPDTYIVVTAGWEPDAIRSADFSFAFNEWHRLRPNDIQALHCWLIANFLQRCVGSSNPIQADDPWQGDEAGFFQSAGGQYLSMVLNELPHGRDLFTPCGRTVPKTVNGVAGFAYPESCWKNRADDYVARIGAGLCTDDIGHATPCGWRKLDWVWFETITFDAFWNNATTDDARRVADWTLELCRTYAVDCGFGDGLPTGGPPVLGILPPANAAPPGQ